jgi:hypothetical protein
MISGDEQLRSSRSAAMHLGRHNVKTHTFVRLLALGLILVAVGAAAFASRVS